jgi:hypothetical protein
MPSSGLPIENLLAGLSDKESRVMCMRFSMDARRALELGMFTEWLECFVGAWNKTHNANMASEAGLIEWDM